MPVSFTIDLEKNVVVATFEGVVTDTELLDYYDRLEAHPDFRSGLRFLSDASRVERADVRAETVRLISQRGQVGAPTARAIVVKKDNPVAYGLTRLAQAHRELAGDEVGVFETAEEAWVWLLGERTT